MSQDSGHSSEYFYSLSSGESQIPKKEFFENKWKIIGYICRTCSYTAILIIAVVNSINGAAMITGEPECIEDKTFIWTSNFNDYFNRNKTYAKYLLIFSSLLLDLNLLISIVFWYKSGKNLKPFITIIFVVLTKAIIDSLFNFKYPKGMIYEYPGFPSLSSSYRKSS